jgi:hypothetical protein
MWAVCTGFGGRNGPNQESELLRILLPTLAARFENADPQEKRLYLVAVLSNSRWKDGQLVVEYRCPFESITSASLLHQKKNGILPKKNAVHPVWYSQRDSNPCFHRERVAT